MQESNIYNFFQRVLHKKINIDKFLQTFLTSMLAFVVVIAIGAGVVRHYRAEVFGYFAEEYLKNTKTASTSSKDKSIEIFTPEEIAKGGPALSNESLVIDAVKKANPAVVSIVISKEVPKYEVYTDPNAQDPFNNLFPGFNFNVPQYRQNGTEKKEIGGGSGFFVSSDGLIVTNRHVVNQTGVEYTVFTNDGKKHPATVVARDSVLDIALIKINNSNYPYLSLGNSSNLEVGQSVIAIGNALGEFKNTVSTGVISGLSRSITAGDGAGNTEFLDKVIQTDAAINPGNSGGPLINIRGEVIGVNVAVAQGGQSIGFALPIDSVKSAIESVKRTGKIVRPYLGVRYVAITPALKEKNKLSVDYGVLVQRGANPEDLAVIPGGPANKAGILENDIILEVDGVKLDEDTSLASVIREKTVGQVIKLKVLSKGVERNVSLILEQAKE